MKQKLDRKAGDKMLENKNAPLEETWAKDLIDRSGVIITQLIEILSKNNVLIDEVDKYFEAVKVTIYHQKVPSGIKLNSHSSRIRQ